MIDPKKPRKSTKLIDLDMPDVPRHWVFSCRFLGWSRLISLSLQLDLMPSRFFFGVILFGFAVSAMPTIDHNSKEYRLHCCASNRRSRFTAAKLCD